MFWLILVFLIMVLVFVLPPFLEHGKNIRLVSVDTVKKTVSGDNEFSKLGTIYLALRATIIASLFYSLLGISLGIGSVYSSIVLALLLAFFQIISIELLNFSMKRALLTPLRYCYMVLSFSFLVIPLRAHHLFNSGGFSPPIDSYVNLVFLLLFYSLFFSLTVVQKRVVSRSRNTLSQLLSINHENRMSRPEEPIASTESQ